MNSEVFDGPDVFNNGEIGIDLPGCDGLVRFLKLIDMASSG